MNKNWIIAVMVFFSIALALEVAAPPLGIWGFVTQDYEPLTTNVSVVAYGDCLGAGVELLDNTSTNLVGYYQLYIPMDESTPPGPVGVDEGCESGDQIDFIVAGNFTDSPQPGVWTVGDWASNPMYLYVTGPFYLVSPANGSSSIDSTPYFEWVHANSSSFNYTLVIDNEPNFNVPFVEQIANITELNYTLLPAEALASDTTYYWRIDVTLNGTANDSSRVFNFALDTTPPAITAASPLNNSWVTGGVQTLSATTNEASTCRASNTAGVAFGTKSISFPQTGTGHTTTINLPNQGNNSYYIQCNDSLGNLMPLVSEYYLNVRFDSAPPDNNSASISIDDGAQYSNDSGIYVNWTGFVDPNCPNNCSGITQYRYNTINNYGSSQLATGPPMNVSGLSDGPINIYLWAVDVAGLVSNYVRDSITIDTTPPVLSNWARSPVVMNNSHTGNVTIFVNVLDVGTGINSYLPQFRYKRGSYDAVMTAYENMTFQGGTTYYYNIPEPAVGSWAAVTDENLEYQVYSRDLLNNTVQSSAYIINVTRENYDPVWIQPTDQQVLEDSEVSIILSATDGDYDTLTYTSNDSAFTITSINRSSANASWTPTNDAVGSRLVWFTVDDGFDQLNSTTITITINNTNDAPVFPTINAQSAYEHSLYSLDASATDVDVGDVLTYSDNSDFFVINANTGEINFTPLYSSRGAHNITVTANDGTTSRNINFTLTVYYCGDAVCNVLEACNNCSLDCGICGAEDTERMAIVIQHRNCLEEPFNIKVYQLYQRATCETQGRIVDGYEVCGNLSDVDVAVYVKNSGTWEEDEDQWNLTGEFVTDELGWTSFIPTQTGQFRMIAKSSGYPDQYEYAEVDICGKDEVPVNESLTIDPDLEPLEPDTGGDELEPTVEEPTILTEEESSLMLFLIYYLIIPILLLSLFSAGTYWYHLEKDNNKQLLLMRIWLKKKTKLLSLYVKYYYHELRGKLGFGKEK